MLQENKKKEQNNRQQKKLFEDICAIRILEWPFNLLKRASEDLLNRLPGDFYAWGAEDLDDCGLPVSEAIIVVRSSEV
jgi:hypothetical protein